MWGQPPRLSGRAKLDGAVIYSEVRARYASDARRRAALGGTAEADVPT